MNLLGILFVGIVVLLLLAVGLAQIRSGGVEVALKRRRLRSSDPIVRKKAVADLGYICQVNRAAYRNRYDKRDYYKAQIKVLSLGLADSEPEIRMDAAKFLGSPDNSDAVEPLLQALKDQDARVRVIVVDALGSIGDPTAWKMLDETLDDKEPEVQLSAARAMGRIADHSLNPSAFAGQESSDRLARLLNDGTVGVRAEAAGALARLGDTRAASPLVELLTLDGNTDIALSSMYKLAYHLRSVRVPSETKTSLKKSLNILVAPLVKLIKSRDHLDDRKKEAVSILNRICTPDSQMAVLKLGHISTKINQAVAASLADYIEVRLIREESDHLEYEYGHLGYRFGSPSLVRGGRLKLLKATGVVSMIELDRLSNSDEGLYEWASLRLKESWAKHQLPRLMNNDGFTEPLANEQI